jgi:hypothetical protein
MIARHTVHVSCSGRYASKKIASAHDEADLNFGPGHFRNLGRQALHSLGVKAKGMCAGQGLTADFQENALIFRHARVFDPMVSGQLLVLTAQKNAGSPEPAVNLI